MPLGDSRTTTATFLLLWCGEVLPGTVKDRTADGYRDILERYVIPAIGSVRLLDLRPEHVHRMLRSLEEGGLSVSTRRLARTVLRRALAHAERWELVPRNVAALIDAPRHRPARIDDALSIDDARCLLQGCGGTVLGSVVACALGTGLRRGEVLGLKWSDVDLEVGQLAVLRTLSRRVGVGLVVDEPKTERSRRVVPLPAFTVATLREQRSRQAAERLAAGPEWEGDGYVFTTARGRPLDPDNVTTRFANLTDRLGLGRRRFHCLRHSAATAMLAAGVPLEVVSRTLGHAGLAITADIYARVLPPAQRDAADRLESALGGT
jgi:integrase